MQPLLNALPAIFIGLGTATATVYAAYLQRGTRASTEDMARLRDELARMTKARDELQLMVDSLRSENAWYMRELMKNGQGGK